MIDTHAHIHDRAFDTDRDSVLDRAKSVGVSGIITIGTSIEESQRAISLANQYPGYVFAGVAVHPHEYSKLPDLYTRTLWKNILRELLENPCVVAIGECGLDFHDFGSGVSEEQKQTQKEGFLDHVQLAIDTQKPLVIHCREAYEDVLEILGKYHTKLSSIILHCYQGDEEVTKKFLDMDEVYISFAGNVTYPIKKILEGTKNDMREIARAVPLERLLVETDCPYLSPQAFRGKRNEPGYVASTLGFLAELYNVSKKELGQKTEQTSRRIFSL